MPQHAHRRSRAIRKAAGPDRAWDAFEPLELRRLLATFTVTNLLDAGAGSLRAAITAANGAAGADSIEFDQSLTGRITLTTGELSITDDLDINGPGADVLAVSGNDTIRVFSIAATAQISGLTITDGRADQGGAIRNTGTLTLLDSVVSSSRGSAGFTNFGDGGGIWNSGTASLIRSTVSGNRVTGRGNEDYGPRGGGIFNSGTLTLTDSTVSENTADGGRDAGGTGGGIFNSGVLTVERSTVSGNLTLSSGSGSFLDPRGGGITNEGTATLINATVSGNTGANISGAITQGKGVFSSGTLTISNSTLVSNKGDDLVVDGGSAILTSSIVEELDGTLHPSSADNLVNVDPRLAPLAYNGGHTLTHALLPDSSAIGAGGNTLSLTTDQRGGLFERTRTAGVDIGAFQSQEAPADLVVSTLSDVNDGDYTPGQLSLREALELAIYTAGPDTITFDPQLSSGTITLVGHELAVLGDVIVLGPGSGLLTLSGANASRVFDVGSGVAATLDGLTITQGLGSITPFTSDEGGGGIYNKGELTLSNAVVSSNAADLGAGIRSLGRLTIIDSTISQNTASTAGGAIHAYGPVTLTDSLLTQNTAFNGAGIIAYGVLTLNDSNVSDNTGGGISAAGPLTLRGSTVSGNTSQFPGAGITASGATKLIDSTVSNNSGDDNGGGIYALVTLTLTRSTVSGNSAAGDGGGVFAHDTLTITDSTVADNTAEGNGGGIYTTDPLTITRSTISGNDADGNGGGIYANGQATITNSTISGNSSEDRGGGLYTGTTLVVLNNSTVADNSAEILGGGIHSGGTLRLRSTIVASNPGFDVAGTVVAGSINNLVQDATVAVGLVNGQNGNIVGVDPLLAPLADNGGPTLTHALSGASPAIGAGSNPLSLTTDQRGTGFARAIDGRTDIGAYQLQTPGSTTLALFGGGQLNQAIAHEAKARRSNGTGFGQVERDDDTKQITYRIANIGPNALVITAIEIRGQRPDDFSIISMPDLILAPGATTEFTVSFDPDAYGSRRANVAIFTNDPANAGRFTMRIAGIGAPDPELPDIAVTAGAADIRDNDRKARPDTGQRFGGVQLGQSVVITYTITNRGLSTLTIGQITINSARFVVTQQPGSTSLAAGQSTTFTVTFTPDNVGSHRAMLSIASNDPDEDPFNFRIAGFGMA